MDAKEQMGMEAECTSPQIKGVLLLCLVLLFRIVKERMKEEREEGCIWM
jgi:hypothetical protein